MYLNLGDTLTAKSCYQQALKINPDYEKGRIESEKDLKEFKEKQDSN